MTRCHIQLSRSSRYSCSRVKASDVVFRALSSSDIEVCHHLQDSADIHMQTEPRLLDEHDEYLTLVGRRRLICLDRYLNATISMGFGY